MPRKKATPPAPPETSDAPETPPVEEGTKAPVSSSAPVKAAQVEAPPNREKSIKVDMHSNGSYILIDAPRGWWFDRRISLIQKGVKGDAVSGWVPTDIVVNLEHVSDDENGIWCYRVM